MTVRNYKVDLKSDPAVAAELLRDGFLVAGVAAGLAPKLTGRGAASISAELASAGGEPEARVSWTTDAYWMMFQEFGTQHHRAQPFLRPAANRFR